MNKKRRSLAEIGNEFSGLAIFAFVLEVFNALCIWLFEAIGMTEFTGFFYCMFGIALLAGSLLSLIALSLRLIVWLDREDGDPRSGTGRTIFAGVILLLNLALVFWLLIAFATGF